VQPATDGIFRGTTDFAKRLHSISKDEYVNWTLEHEFLYVLLTYLEDYDGDKGEFLDYFGVLYEAYKNKNRTPLNADMQKRVDMLNGILYAFHKPFLDVSQRIIGKCLRGGGPGEMMDILLTF
jgi:hypothetical protein